MLTERARHLRSHPGQVSFPGGALDPGDAGPCGAALREAREEVGHRPGGVEVVAELPALYLRPSELRRDAGAGVVARAGAGRRGRPAPRCAGSCGRRWPTCSTRPTGSP